MLDARNLRPDLMFRMLNWKNNEVQQVKRIKGHWANKKKWAINNLTGTSDEHQVSLSLCRFVTLPLFYR